MSARKSSSVRETSHVFLLSLCQSVSALNAISITTLGSFMQTIMGSIGDLLGLSDERVWYPENSSGRRMQVAGSLLHRTGCKSDESLTATTL